MRARIGACRVAVLAAASALACSFGALAQPAGVTGGERIAWLVADDVVRITTTLPDGSAAEEGFGFVFGESNGRIYVVTADHVVRQGKSDGNEGKAEGSLKVQVIFRGDQGHRYDAELLDLQLLPERGDLAVLQLPKPPSFRAAWPSVADADALVPGVRAWRIGKVERWIPATVPGEFVGRSALWLAFDNLDTPRGSSGGPVVTQDGIVGMVVAEGGMTGVPSDVLPIGTIEGVLREWQLPWNLRSDHKAPVAEPPSVAAPTEPVVSQPQPTPSASDTTAGAAADSELALDMSLDDRKAVQRWLNQLGFAAGGEDGVLGAQTRDALKAYQARSGLPVTGYVDAVVEARLASDRSHSAISPVTSAVTSVPTMDEAGLKRFTLRYFAMLSAPGTLDFLRQSSADTVRYYGRDLNREQFLAQESSAFERWPERSFAVRQYTLTASCDARNLCKASGTADYALRSVPRAASANGSMRFSLKLGPGVGGAPVITEVDSVTTPGPSAVTQVPPPLSPVAPATMPSDPRWTTRTVADCAARYYTWRMSSDLFEFTDQSGQTDIERVAERNGSTVVTQTVSSSHRDSPTAAGTRWSYRFEPDGRVKVRNMQGGNSFTLTRCPS